MRGGGSGAILEALPMPLGSTVTLFIPPAFAGPGAIPLMDRFPEPAPPAILAYEAAGAASTARSARVIFAEVLVMMRLHYARKRWVCGGDVGLSVRRRH
jgi:hypothetical protein